MLLHGRRERELAGAAAREAETRHQTPGKRWEDKVPARAGLSLPQAAAHVSVSRPSPTDRQCVLPLDQHCWGGWRGGGGGARALLSRSLRSRGRTQVIHPMKPGNVTARDQVASSF